MSTISLPCQPFHHSNRLNRHNNFYFEQHCLVPFHRNIKTKIKLPMLNPLLLNFTLVFTFLKLQILLKWLQLKILALIVLAQLLLSWIFNMLFCIKFGFEQICWNVKYKNVKYACVAIYFRFNQNSTGLTEKNLKTLTSVSTLASALSSALKNCSVKHLCWSPF